jgi:hypothetical protein
MEVDLSDLETVVIAAGPSSTATAPGDATQRRRIPAAAVRRFDAGVVSVVVSMPRDAIHSAAIPYVDAILTAVDGVSDRLAADAVTMKTGVARSERIVDRYGFVRSPVSLSATLPSGAHVDADVDAPASAEGGDRGDGGDGGAEAVARERRRASKWAGMLAQWDAAALRMPTGSVGLATGDAESESGKGVAVQQRGRLARAVVRRVRKGVPDAVRSAVWWRLAMAPGSVVGDEAVLARDALSYYDALRRVLRAATTRVDLGQIHLDVIRTYREHELFADTGSDKQGELFRVCAAHAELEEAGYCQGMNEIAAVLLFYMEEVRAFSTLRALFWKARYAFARIYTANLSGARVAFDALDRLAAARQPRVFAHLVCHEVSMTMTMLLIESMQMITMMMELMTALLMMMMM